MKIYLFCATMFISLFSCSTSDEISTVDQKSEHESAQQFRGINNGLVTIINAEGSSFTPNNIQQFSCSRSELSVLGSFTSNTFFDPSGVLPDDIAEELNEIFYCSDPIFSTCQGSTIPDEIWNVTFKYSENDIEHGDPTFNPTLLDTTISPATANMFRDLFACESLDYGDTNFISASTYRISNIEVDASETLCDTGLDPCNRNLIATTSFYVYY